MQKEVPALPAEPLPTPLARLTIKVGPEQHWGTAEGTVPPDQAHHLITTFGILASACTGIGGGVLTLSIVPSLTALALAELILSLVAMVLTAACSLTGARRENKHRKIPRTRAPRDSGHHDQQRMPELAAARVDDEP
jgi:hypothetical protein